MPRPCAGRICRTDAAAAVTGSSATSPTARGGASTCACTVHPPARAPRATGPMPRRASMAICSISSGSRAACRACARRSSRRAPSWLSRPDAAGRPGSPAPSVAQLGGGRAPSVPGGAADCRHAGRGLPRSPGPRRDRLAVAALSPVLLRSRLRRGPAPNLAGAPRRDHRRAWGRDGVHRTWLDPSGCGLAPIRAPRRSLGQPARQRRALRRLRRPSARGGRGSRDGALRAGRPAPRAGGGRALGQSPRRPRAARAACRASTSRATATPPEPARRSGCASAPKRPASSRCATSIRCTMTSTTTCAAWGLRGSPGMSLCSSTRPTSAGCRADASGETARAA